MQVSKFTFAASLLLPLCLAQAESPGALIQTVAGAGRATDNGDRGDALKVNIAQPFGVEFGPEGALYVCDVGNHRIWRVDLDSGKAVVVAGCGEKGYSGDGGPATKAKLNEPYEVRFDSAGNMVFVEMQNHVVRRVNAKTKAIETIAGSGQPGYGGDGGPATKAQLARPHSIAFDANDNLFIADIGNHRIRRVDAKTGVIETIAGNGKRALPRDGSTARDRAMAGPRALFIRDNTLWIALREGHSVWKLNLASGRLAHVAGTGRKGYSGDDGPAAKATFNGPKGIAVGPKGHIFVVDTENQAIRRIDAKTGQITTVAGSGPRNRGGKGDGGPAARAWLDRPHGVCVGPDGAIYIGDTNNHRVRVVRVAAAN